MFRAGEELSAGSATVLKVGDTIRVTGSEPRLAAFGAGVIRATHASDVMMSIVAYFFALFV